MPTRAVGVFDIFTLTAPRTLEAIAGATIAGSAKMGPNRPGRGAHVATASFMVDLGFEVLATVPEAFDHPEHGLVGLHVMFLRLTP